MTTKRASVSASALCESDQQSAKPPAFFLPAVIDYIDQINAEKDLRILRFFPF